MQLELRIRKLAARTAVLEKLQDRPADRRHGTICRHVNSSLRGSLIDRSVQLFVFADGSLQRFEERLCEQRTHHDPDDAYRRRLVLVGDLPGMKLPEVESELVLVVSDSKVVGVARFERADQEACSFAL